MAAIEADDIWPVVRRLYEASSLPVSEVARLTGVSRRTLQARARREGWTPRNKRREGTDAARAGIATRLWGAMARQVDTLESAGEGGEPKKAQELSTLARTLEKLLDVERGMTAQAQAAPDEGPMDLDEFRDQIAQRLETLLAEDAD